MRGSEIYEKYVKMIPSLPQGSEDRTYYRSLVEFMRSAKELGYVDSFYRMLEEAESIGKRIVSNAPVNLFYEYEKLDWLAIE